MYKVENNVVLKTHENGDVEELCSINEIGEVIERDREAIAKLENLLKDRKTMEDSALSIMFSNYVVELDALSKIQLLNK